MPQLKARPRKLSLALSLNLSWRLLARLASGYVQALATTLPISGSMKLLRIFSISVLALFLAACAAPGQGWMGAPLKDTSWRLMTVQSNVNESGREYVANESDITMNLRANGDAQFTVGCQKGSTDWVATPGEIDSKGEIRFYPLEIAASDAVCAPGLIEQRFLRDFDFMRGYVLIQNHLYISTMANEVVYGWRKIEDK